MKEDLGPVALDINEAILIVGVPTRVRPIIAEEALAAFDAWSQKHLHAQRETRTAIARQCVHDALNRYQARVRQRMQQVEKELALNLERQAFETKSLETQEVSERLYALAVNLVEAIIAPYGLTLDDLEHGIVERRGVVSIRKSRVAIAMMRRHQSQGTDIQYEAARKRVANAIRAIRTDRGLSDFG